MTSTILIGYMEISVSLEILNDSMHSEKTSTIKECVGWVATHTCIPALGRYSQEDLQGSQGDLMEDLRPASVLRVLGLRVRTNTPSIWVCYVAQATLKLARDWRGTLNL